MTDEELRRILQREMDAEAEYLMELVNSDPSLKDVKAPEELHDRLFAQIREYEEQKKMEVLSDEDKELIRLGKIYRKRRKWNKVAVLVAAVIAVLALGTVSVGENKNILSLLKQILSGGEQTVSDSGSTEPTQYIVEEDVFEKIEAEYGVTPIKLEYLPKDIGFKEAVFCGDIQTVYMYYGTEDGADITYIIRPYYRESSFATVIEDDKLQEYTMIIDDIEITLVEYYIVDSGENRWSILWECQDVQYMLNITDMEQVEVEKMINTLRFIK